MRYTAMRLMCFFDLPTETKADLRYYRIFRKSLLANGFQMIQFSVYVRTCPNRSFAMKYEALLTKYLPPNGEVRLMMVTEKQYEDMTFLVGKKSQQEEVIGDKRLVVIE
ncbi:CRISPR-associated endonuclease Cas2 [Vagococcus xieshaowenii]|uniref:CRISPR-associated endoribonuclease Cas2 n=1 Tax=Vagococcus xieshaowenii TaxID=2562451 RepID=A0AAJ5JLJ6_9ENTE|nr:CRISPR-associated endonuclease Cas2 [Vagococcus xieshaowenii]QCA28730.1 CRISPR-associated endonuclease Cas2 [Vagococcus xieshaowenii]TFZ40462.1 CRISPR-associated endonuclease Cas2 [Vagococcus xieshaowenii]